LRAGSAGFAGGGAGAADKIANNSDCMNGKEYVILQIGKKREA